MDTIDKIKDEVLYIKLSGAGKLDGHEGNYYPEAIVLKLCDKLDELKAKNETEQG